MFVHRWPQRRPRLARSSGNDRFLPPNRLSAVSPERPLLESAARRPGARLNVGAPSVRSPSAWVLVSSPDEGLGISEVALTPGPSPGIAREEAGGETPPSGNERFQPESIFGVAPFGDGEGKDRRASRSPADPGRRMRSSPPSPCYGREGRGAIGRFPRMCHPMEWLPAVASSVGRTTRTGAGKDAPSLARSRRGRPRRTFLVGQAEADELHQPQGVRRGRHAGP